MSLASALLLCLALPCADPPPRLNPAKVIPAEAMAKPAIPEPGTLLLVGSGLVGIAIAVRRRSKRSVGARQP